MHDLKKYEYVLAIAREGGIARAAQSLNMAQPTLSRYVKKLETELGVELFDRSSIPISLTPAGECFAETGRRMLDAENQLHKQLREIKLGGSTVIRVGISPTRAPYLIPAMVEEYRNRRPDGRVRVVEGTTAELNRMLGDGEIDLAISILDQTDADFERVHLFHEDILLAVPVKLCKEGDTFEDVLRRVPLINVGRGLVLWKAMNELVTALGIDEPELECRSVESAIALVRRGLGATIVPSYIQKYGTAEENGGVRFFPIPTERYPEWESICKRQVCLFYRREQFLSKEERLFIECARAIKDKTERE